MLLPGQLLRSPGDAFWALLGFAASPSCSIAALPCAMLAQMIGAAGPMRHALSRRCAEQAPTAAVRAVELLATAPADEHGVHSCGPCSFIEQLASDEVPRRLLLATSAELLAAALAARISQPDQDELGLFCGTTTALLS